MFIVKDTWTHPIPPRIPCRDWLQMFAWDNPWECLSVPLALIACTQDVIELSGLIFRRRNTREKKCKGRKRCASNIIFQDLVPTIFSPSEHGRRRQTKRRLHPINTDRWGEFNHTFNWFVIFIIWAVKLHRSLDNALKLPFFLFKRYIN